MTQQSEAERLLAEAMPHDFVESQRTKDQIYCRRCGATRWTGRAAGEPAPSCLPSSDTRADYRELQRATQTLIDAWGDDDVHFVNDCMREVRAILDRLADREQPHA